MSFRIIKRIAKTELAALFYSPVAWLLLVVFAVHIGCDFLDILREIIKIKATGRAITFSATAGVVLGSQGIYEVIQDSIYLYIPLLTMNLMSREYATGSDKLLYSSPVSSAEIILGKFLSMVFCSAVFTLILALPAVGVTVIVPHADIPLMLSALLSMFLLIMTYCSIGLFMSSLTAYQVVSAVATLSVLAFFNYVGEIGQNSLAIREITYWLSIKGRASEMVGGLICSDDVIYFIAVTAFFLVLSIIRLNNHRIKRTVTDKLLRYGATFACLVLVAFISSRPSMKTFYDATSIKERTISEESQAVMRQLKGGMSITTYINVFDPEFQEFIPSKQMKDRERFKMYTRFKPEIKMRYVYYYPPVTDTAILNRYPGLSDSQIAREIATAKGYPKSWKLVKAKNVKEMIDLEEEHYQFVRVVKRASGEEARLRLFNDMMHHPSETEISAAMKKMIVPPVKVNAVTGHRERSVKKNGDRDYSIFAASGQFRNSMINQGFDLSEVNLSDGEMPSDISILLIADPVEKYSEEELNVLDSMVRSGVNMFLALDCGRGGNADDLLSTVGLKTGECFDSEQVIPARATDGAVSLLKGTFRRMQRLKGVAAVNMPGACSLEISDTSSFKATALLVTDNLTSPSDIIVSQSGGVTSPSESVVSQSGKVTTPSENVSPSGKVTTPSENVSPSGKVATPSESVVSPSGKVASPSENVSPSGKVASSPSQRVLSYALQRTLENGREQRIIVFGDADCFSNSYLQLVNRQNATFNFSLLPTSFRWLCYGEFPVSSSREARKDNDCTLTPSQIPVVRNIYCIAIPLVISATGLIILRTRRRR